ncbi:MAG: glycosyltransferase family 2 protein [Acetobacteraceae bacterium]|nr:glycosyltransferase family 2 protein [Acetobacteraceae bacterium]
MLSIVIPMAGAGHRFAEAGYAAPKPLIPIHGVPMIRLVIANLRPAGAHRFIFIVRQAQLDGTPTLRDQLAEWAPGCGIAVVPGLTQGAACTVLAARAAIPDDAPMLIANCDQWVEAPIGVFLAAATAGPAPPDGAILTMRATDPKWSFARRGPDGWVAEVAEKVPISNEATVGLYYFARAGDFFAAALAMIAAEERVNGEFYVAPVYNRMIAAGARIAAVPIGAEGAGMHGLGTPADLTAFLATAESHRAAALARADRP